MGKVLKRPAKVFSTRCSFHSAKSKSGTESCCCCNSDGLNDKASIFRRFIIKLKGKEHASLPVQLLPDASHHQLNFTKAVIMLKTVFEISLTPGR